ncbi:MAG: thioredoxin family protein [Chlorobi bacterium]|nr:MAG: thioredoxin family protein [Bacteroidota bacterium]KXK33155.1 MAG: thioredoxin-like protein [Chlorobi bacterium OLB6]MBE2265625.1 thioredoxin family protein [Flavobacteriales bacterium]MBL1160453.1 thioredoxin family protein [Chlorobiota bacterium]MBW7853598.1 thioredoxin family protein [Candidatus Kapabacteria bacterium]MCC6331211.1 thioredoxin family protein [Ignavibacteria bacterium]
MAATSSMMPLGTKMPEFALYDVLCEGIVSLPDKPAVATVVAFICNHCPYVHHIISEFVRFAHLAQKSGIRVIAVCSNDSVQYPDDSPEKMKEFATAHGFRFPYLVDESQAVARAFQAECTPDLYIFDAENRCVYRGRFDASTPGNGMPVTGADMYDAISSLLNGQPVSGDQFPSIGCSIKWKSR